MTRVELKTSLAICPARPHTVKSHYDAVLREAVRNLSSPCKNSSNMLCRRSVTCKNERPARIDIAINNT
jgi:hypothetical protein